MGENKGKSSESQQRSRALLEVKRVSSVVLMKLAAYSFKASSVYLDWPEPNNDQSGAVLVGRIGVHARFCRGSQ